MSKARKNAARLLYPLNPRADFGAVGDGVTDDTAAIAACFAAAAGRKVVFDATAEGYKVTDALEFPSNAHLDMAGAWIKYMGATNKVALSVGSGVGVNLNVVLQNLDVRNYGLQLWASDSFIGIRLRQLYRSNISINAAIGFTVGVECYSANAGFAYNSILVGQCLDNKYGMQLKCYTAAANGNFINENMISNGRFGTSSASNGMGDAYGVHITAEVGAYTPNNNNLFIKPCFELNGNGTEVRVPMFLNGAGSYCRVEQARHETGNGPFAIIDSTLTGAAALINNVFEVGYQGSNGVWGTLTHGISEIGLAYNNIYKSYIPVNRTNLTWHSGHIPALLSGRIANTPYIAGPLHFVQNAATVVKFLTSTSLDVELGADGLEYLTSNSSAVGIGVHLDTTKSKRFFLSAATMASFPGRYAIQCFDASGAILTDVGDVQKYVYTGSTLAYTAQIGGCYRRQSDGICSDMVTFKDTVKSARIMFVGGSAALKIRAFSITALGVSEDNPLSVYCPLTDDPFQKLSSAKPDTAGEFGRYAVGNVVLNSGAAAGQPSHWSCSVAGRLAKQWVTLTVYTTGQVRYLGANVYVVRTGGTAGATGPTGTGTGITDGTVVWDFVSTKAVFVTSQNLI